MRRHRECQNAPSATVVGSRGRALLLSAALLLWAAPMSASAAADDSATGGGAGGVWHALLEHLDFKAKPAAVPDFVEATRPDPSTLDFIAPGRQGAKRPEAAKTPAQVKATEALLDAARERQLAPPAPPPAKAKPKKPGRPDASK